MLVTSPKSDIYVAMLGIALAAIILACLLMGLMLNQYGFSVKAVRNDQPLNPALARRATVLASSAAPATYGTTTADTV